MIRYYTKADEDAVIRIWLNASRQAHGFVPPGFWEEMEHEVRDNYLPQLQVWVYDDNMTGEVVGFMSMRDNYIAALFVEPERQGESIGFQLINKAKGLHPELELKVFKENHPSVAFYERQGFFRTGEGIDPETGHPEWHMKFRMV